MKLLNWSVLFFLDIHTRLQQRLAHIVQDADFNDDEIKNNNNILQTLSFISILCFHESTLMV